MSTPANPQSDGSMPTTDAQQSILEDLARESEAASIIPAQSQHSTGIPPRSRIGRDRVVHGGDSDENDEVGDTMQETVTHKRRLQFRKSRSLYGVNPSSKLGPKAALLQGATLTVQDPSAQRLQWCKTPMSVLVLRKPGDCDVHIPYTEVVSFLIQRDLIVFVEQNSLEPGDIPTSQVKNLRNFISFQDDLSEKVDFIITLGGDGTLIHASSLFQQSVPPVLAFNMGSLGFLTPFDIENMRPSIESALVGKCGLTLRSRLKCVLCTKEQNEGLPHVKELENGHKGANHHGLISHMVLNEVVIDRGASSYLCNLDLYVDREHVTSVQGDGLIISTPTGSTAYATAAGASMIHPSVPAILIVPICAHSLSFRPIVLPAGVEVTIMLSPNARDDAYAAFDGRSRTRLGPGDSLRITTSIYPMPSICATSQLNDWFNSLAECLHWNVRRQQKKLTQSSTSSSTAGMSDLSLSDEQSE